MKNNFQKILIFTSLTFLLFGFVFLFFYQEINDHNQKTQQDTINLQTETFRRNNIASLNQSLQEITPDKVLLDSHFVKSSDIVPFLNLIEKVASEVGVFIQINSVDSKENNSELIVGLKISGRFEAIYKFLTLLENSPYELEFLSMDIKKLTVSETNTKDSNWEAVFKIQLLSFIP
ncbi:MAG: hypothetical protein WC694_02320 [Candidatus Paceibacterota bacterium]|jgi:hypothetical protein